MDLIIGGDDSSDTKLSDPGLGGSTLDESSNDYKLLSTPDESTSDFIKKERSLTKSASSRVITADTTHVLIEPTHIIEYEWPPKSGERYFLQEQIAELLDVKSFKRKYPDLNRHTIEINEREHLLATYKLASVMNEHQMHGLTAIRAIEVHELMATDYPAIYSEYQRATAEKAKLQIAEQQKQLDAIKMDTKKLEELRKTAIKSALEFNMEMNSLKKAERTHFWDIQTSVIQSPQNRWKRLDKVASRPGPYPAALIPGQYQRYYKRFTSEQLRQLPLNSILEYDRLIPLKRERSPSPINIPDNETSTQGDDEPSSFPKLEIMDSQSQPGGEDHSQDLKDVPCSTCGVLDDKQKLRCSACRTVLHPECANIPERIVDVALTYKWCCLDCKLCTVCEKPEDEDAVLFCDRCDRGYHTYCVGLKAPPSGTWICSNFCASDDQVRCKRCNVSLSKENVNGRKHSRRSNLDKYCDDCFSIVA